MKRLVGRGVIMLAGCLFAFVAIEIALHVAFPRMRLLMRHTSGSAASRAPT